MDNLTDQIREAIAHQDYGTALRLWNSYAAQLQDELNRGSLSSERMAEALELFKWSCGVLLCARAQNLDRLNAIHVAGAYASMFTSR